MTHDDSSGHHGAQRAQGATLRAFHPAMKVLTAPAKARGPRALRPRDNVNAGPYATATLRAISKSSSGIGTGRRHVNETGRSPR